MFHGQGPTGDQKNELFQAKTVNGRCTCFLRRPRQACSVGNKLPGKIFQFARIIKATVVSLIYIYIYIVLIIFCVFAKFKHSTSLFLIVAVLVKAIGSNCIFPMTRGIP